MWWMWNICQHVLRQITCWAVGLLAVDQAVISAVSCVQGSSQGKCLKSCHPPPPLYSFKLDSICFKAKILYFTDGVQCRYIMHCRKTNFTRWVSQNDDDDKRRHIKLLKNKMLPVVGMESSSLALRSRCLSDCAILTQSKEFRFCLWLWHHPYTFKGVRFWLWLWLHERRRRGNFIYTSQKHRRMCPPISRPESPGIWRLLGRDRWLFSVGWRPGWVAGPPKMQHFCEVFCARDMSRPCGRDPLCPYIFLHLESNTFGCHLLYNNGFGKTPVCNLLQYISSFLLSWGWAGGSTSLTSL